MKAAAYVLTRNYYRIALPSIKSLLVHSDVDKIYILCEDDELPFGLPKTEAVNVSGMDLFDPDGPNYSGTRFSHAVLFKAAVHKIFPELDKILIIDADTICVEDVSELWDIPLDDCYYAGAKEPTKSKGGIWEQEDLYINAGVMMANLEKLRDGTGDRILHRLNTEQFVFCEQDCINNECQGGILEIDSCYNANSFTAEAAQPKILHSAAIDGWFNFPIVQLYDSIQ